MGCGEQWNGKKYLPLCCLISKKILAHTVCVLINKKIGNLPFQFEVLISLPLIFKKRKF